MDTTASTNTNPPAQHTPTDTKTLRSAARFFFGFPGPRLIVAVIVAAWATKIWLGNFGLYDVAIMVAIIALWPLQEWLIHVFILHFKPFKLFGRTMDLYPAVKHRAHHQDPWQIEDVFIPLRSLPLALGIAIAFWFLLFPVELAASGLAFYVSMALVYEWTHFLIHTNYRPRTRFYRRLWKNHRLHHFKNENYWFGVSMLSGDRILGTAPGHKEVETSATCRTIVGEK